jgi:hypothetical protein
VGLYNTFGDLGVQLKVGELECAHFLVGEPVDIDDGVYIGYSGVIVVDHGIFVAEFPHLTDKWGGEISCDELVRDNNPVAKAMREALGLEEEP